jgi:predicted GNAT superfamily acetyltransferase
MAEIVIRRLEAIEEFHQAEEVQRQVWEMENDREVVPAHLLITAQKNGGLVLGAFDGKRMVGYLFGFLGRTEDGKLKHCSHQLGVLASHRGRGIGAALKAEQRRFVIQQGLDLVTWTYDPLESANARLNIAKLGAICRTYLRNVYGELRDRLNVGLPTDRFQVEWWVRSPRVEARFAGKATPPSRTLDDVLAAGGKVVNEVQFDASGLPETLAWEPVQAPAVIVEIPASFQQIKAQNLNLARDWRFLTRAIFETYFDEGYTVVDFITTVEDGRRRSFYVLEPNVDLGQGTGHQSLGAQARAGIQAGMDLYNAGKYWESHEALEEVWLAAPPETRLFLQGLIQASAAFHKYLVQKNAVGAIKLLTRALDKLTRYSDDYLGLDMGSFKLGLHRCWRQIITLGQRHCDEFDPQLVPALRWIGEAPHAP